MALISLVAGGCRLVCQTSEDMFLLHNMHIFSHRLFVVYVVQPQKQYEAHLLINWIFLWTK